MDRSALLKFNLPPFMLRPVAAADGGEAVAGSDPRFDVLIIDGAAIREDRDAVARQLARGRVLLLSCPETSTRCVSTE